MTTTSELSALIVRNIGDVERIRAHLDDEMRTQLLKAVAAIFKNAEYADWHIEADSENVAGNWIALSPWVDHDDPEETLFSCLLGCSDNCEEDESWISHFTQSAPSGSDMGIYISNSIRGKNKTLKTVFGSNTKRRDKMFKNGWRLDNFDIPRVPFVIDKEELAAGFEEGDLSIALQPLEDAIQKVVNSAKDLDSIRDDIIKSSPRGSRT